MLQMTICQYQDIENTSFFYFSNNFLCVDAANPSESHLLSPESVLSKNVKSENHTFQWDGI
jgi:hypothetical protein